jgi:hypothetical protein
MTVGSHPYYARTGTPIAFATWVRGGTAADVPRFEAFVGRHYRDAIATQNAAPTSDLFDDLTLRKTTCHPTMWSGRLIFLRSWGRTNTGTDGSLHAFVGEYIRGGNYFYDDRVDFAEAIKAGPKAKVDPKPEPKPTPAAKPPRVEMPALVIQSNEPTPEQKAAQAAREAERRREAQRKRADEAARQAANDAEAKAQRAAQLERERKRRLECPSLNCQ